MKALSSIKNNQLFKFGAVVFKRMGDSEKHDLVLCKIHKEEAYLYISKAALVSTDTGWYQKIINYFNS